MLTKRYRSSTKRKEWALVSQSNPLKILKWFGIVKPSQAAVEHEEKRVTYFKNKAKW